MADSNSSRIIESDDLDRLSLKLGAIDAQVDGLAMLATTGSIQSLKEGGLVTSLLDIGERITEAKRLLDDLHVQGGRHHD